MANTQEQPMQPHSAPPLNHIPSMPSFPTFQMPQHPSNSDSGPPGHDLFLQSVNANRDMADGGPATNMEVNNPTSSQGFNMISSEVRSKRFYFELTGALLCFQNFLVF